jgi:epoxyqueuosine reductase
MTSRERAILIHHWANQAGLIRVGFARAGELPRREYVDSWLSAGRHGEMQYLSKWHPLRMDPRNLLPGARSVIVLAENYKQEPENLKSQISNLTSSRVAQYAWGRDYHSVLRKKLKRLVETMRAEFDESFETRICVDTAPLLERELAMLAGIGWIGKNTMVLHQEAGSFFFLAEIVTTLDLEPSAPATDHCGTCTRCLDACPTAALIAPYQMDATRCISYLTIEHRSEIAPELRPLVGDWLYGCDICQDVCPYNAKAPIAAEPDYRPRVENTLLPSPSVDEVLSLTADEYAVRFQGSAMKRASLEMLKRNSEIVKSNARI